MAACRVRELLDAPRQTRTHALECQHSASTVAAQCLCSACVVPVQRDALKSHLLARDTPATLACCPRLHFCRAAHHIAFAVSINAFRLSALVIRVRETRGERDRLKAVRRSFRRNEQQTASAASDAERVG